MVDSNERNKIKRIITDALDIRKAELFPLQDKVPFQSAENDINNLPNVSDILKGIFGQQESSLVKQYDHGGVHLPTAESDTTNVYQQLNIPIAQEEQYVDAFGNTAGSFYPSGPETTLWQKIKNAAANPLATFGYSARGEDIPWGNVPRHSNPFDTFALGMINPASWWESAEASQDALDQGNYLGAGAEFLGALPFVPASIAAIKKIAPPIPMARSLGKEVDRTLLGLFRGNKWQSTAQRESALKHAADWSKKWHLDPATQTKLTDLGLRNKVLQGLQRGTHKTTIPTYKQWTDQYTRPGHFTGGWSRPNYASRAEELSGDIVPVTNYVNPIRSRAMTPQDISSIAVHEGGTHGLYPRWMYSTPGPRVGDNLTMLSKDTKLGKIFKKDVEGMEKFVNKMKPANFDELSEAKKSKFLNKTENNYRYLSKPNEMHARINEMRLHYHYKPGEKITTREAAMILEDIKLGRTLVDSNWASIFKNSDALKKMMNAAPAALPVAATTLRE